MAKFEYVNKDTLEERLVGKRTLAKREREAALANARAIAAIQVETERQLAAIRAQSQTLPQTPIVSAPPVEPGSRKAVVEPLLLAKGWSLLIWATEAGVAVDTAADYLAGKTKPYRRTRVKLAKALGIPVQQLPR